jgi:hypothetical protein
VSRRWSVSLALAIAAASLVSAAGPALGADPTSAPASAAHESLITTNARVGEELVWWGLRLLIVCFVGLAGGSLWTFVQGLREKSRGARALEQGGLGLTELLSAALKAMPDLIKTPAGIGGLILILGVLMLLGTAAIDTHQLSDAPAATEAIVTPVPTAPPASSGPTLPANT